ncbi:glutamine synthetase family protein [Haliea salexigens]|uniref:glutamine synthetase family protein n=1 Tax=Haliea salexigens TaxID=287487 RepID=UPI00040B49C0|nr:glutamine synthetase family protein [Haliea salexigens]
MENAQQHLQDFLQGNPDIEVFEVMLPDIGGGLRGKWVNRDKIHKVVAGELKLPASSVAFDAWGRDIEAWIATGGDGDGYCEADASTLARVPWMPRATGQVMLSMREADGSPGALDPRFLLRNILQRFAERGLTPVLATEMEFYLLGPDNDALGRPLHTQPDRVGGQLHAGQTYGLDTMADMAPLMHDIRDACSVQRLPVDTLIKEGAPSQYEINLLHCADALKACDQAVMLRRLIRGVARKHSLRATFMAKPFGDLAGNGMHVHCSVLDADGNNLFDDGTDTGTPQLRQAIAGCLASMEDCMLLFAPHLNSYRRFRRGTHAPEAPCWGYENRTVSVRVPADQPAATRLEHRLAGADAHPHLVVAAILAGMLHGIEHQLEPPPPVAGNAYDQVARTLPRYWPDAVERFRKSSFIREHFGAEFQRVFTLMKEQEMHEFDRQVTPLEYDTSL